MRSDFGDLGGYDQVGRALRQLTAKKNLIRIGYGLYSKVKTSFVTGEVIPQESLPVLAKEAMRILGVPTSPTRAETDYQTGKSTQIPTGRLIGVESRISRKITYKGSSISYEYARR
ncbi:hypothetical protein KE626_09445 [Chitinophaga sp. 2R12]|uniref:S-adenosylhomocysteine hydrolase n=2 Tax=Chitinophagaceae TaxID=563835 RepID=A0ABS5IX28_9BACT|nr:hypothetical protein [Chitinophaga hostae]